MKRCILHVGMHKTGTSSIQKSLAGHTDAMFAYYTDHNARTNHSAAVFALVGKPGAAQRYHALMRGTELRVGQNRRPKAQAAFDAAIQRLDGRCLVISGEGISTLSADELGQIATFLRTRGIGRIEITAYIRPPGAFITSWLQQRIKSGGIAAHLSRASEGNGGSGVGDGELGIARSYCHYELTFRKFDDVFGRENVHLWKFDPVSFPNGCVVQDFCTKLGVALPAASIVRSNESLSREALSLLYTFYMLDREAGAKLHGRSHRRLIETLAHIGDTKFRLSPELLSRLVRKQRTDIDWMEARLGQSLDEHFGESRPSDVRSGSDLLRPDPAAVDCLLKLLGDGAPAGIRGETPEEVAMLVGMLARRAPSPDKTAHPRAGLGVDSLQTSNNGRAA